MVATLTALSAMLTLMLVAVAALNSVLLDTRERVRAIGVHKALGMTPRQTVAMVVTSVVMTGLVAGALGVPVGVALHGWFIPTMGDSAGLRLPGSVIAVYHGAEFLPLSLGGCLSPPWARSCPPAGPPAPEPPRPCAPNSDQVLTSGGAA